MSRNQYLKKIKIGKYALISVNAGAKKTTEQSLLKTQTSSPVLTFAFK
jgi:hypothetical protein